MSPRAELFSGDQGSEKEQFLKRMTIPQLVDLAGKEVLVTDRERVTACSIAPVIEGKIDQFVHSFLREMGEKEWMGPDNYLWVGHILDEDSDGSQSLHPIVVSKTEFVHVVLQKLLAPGKEAEALGYPFYVLARKGFKQWSFLCLGEGNKRGTTEWSSMEINWGKNFSKEPQSYEFFWRSDLEKGFFYHSGILIEENGALVLADEQVGPERDTYSFLRKARSGIQLPGKVYSISKMGLHDFFKTSRQVELEGGKVGLSYLSTSGDEYNLRRLKGLSIVAQAYANAAGVAIENI